MYVWFFYKNLDDLKKEGEKTQQAIDSIDFVAYDDSPVWTFEKSGSYKVKLVSKKNQNFQFVWTLPIWMTLSRLTLHLSLHPMFSRQTEMA